MKRVSTSSFARSRAVSATSARTPLHAQPQSAAPFSTFLSAVNTNTLGFLREKLITHDVDSPHRRGKRSEVGLMPVARDLHRNIFFNSNERSALRHVELTKDHIRLEFSEPNEEYRKHADLLFATDAERRAQGVPRWLIPVELQNNEHCGGGATILLDKRHVYDSLRSQARRRGSPKQHAARQ